MKSSDIESIRLFLAIGNMIMQGFELYQAMIDNDQLPTPEQMDELRRQTDEVHKRADQILGQLPNLKPHNPSMPEPVPGTHLVTP